MTNLSVNLNKIALLRNSRNLDLPSVIQAANTCINAGAHGITVHPRPDERHIKYADVYALAEILTVEFNVEGNPTPEFMEIVCRVQPTQCTLVPDAPDAFTSDRGWNLLEESDCLIPIIQQLKDLGIRVSLFMECDLAQIQRAQEIGADRIELYTEPYATAYRTGNVESVFIQYANAARKAQSIGLGVNAGHDLNLHNLGKFCSIPGILEVSIGHALVADALDMGLFNAVKQYLKVLSNTKGD
ncbi:pyridoxine 5'-phosphate synthase [Aliterella atlantica]|uniref:Pyridoxine 5'-phosphate synthase n=1 Tax=Aliterella atlantica CENA595 TaxID=1618023 RepID=A0A0D8ZQK3_9CYAN|nr:pyridoxine 5'-phosphate synthase [Aliterella atlantica]KJH70749.1 pyridoxamine 5'-phosphate oxidase [Aliterella atlantica CENA595]